MKKKDASFRSLLHNAVFFRTYSKVFDARMLVEAEYVNQFNEEIGKMSYQERLSYAETLIRKYASAEFVITSRIHCGLPCLGLDTPIIFVRNEQSGNMSTDRFGGLMDLFNVITWSKDRLLWNEKKRMTFKNIPQNKPNWEKISENLVRICENFAR